MTILYTIFNIYFDSLQCNGYWVLIYGAVNFFTNGVRHEGQSQGVPNYQTFVPH